MAVSRADKACAEVINGLKISGLTWGVQETPYSAYVTIRKKFQKGADFNNLSASRTQSGRAVEDETLRRNLEKLNSDYNALKTSLDTEKAVTQSQKADYKTLSYAHDSLLKSFENLKLDYAAEVDNSENLTKSLQLVNQELEQKSKVIKSIPPDYLDALERLRSDKPCCRGKSEREEALETKLKSAEYELKDAKSTVNAFGSELFDLRQHYQTLSSATNTFRITNMDKDILLESKDKLINFLKNQINNLVTNRNCFDDSYSYPADLFDHQLPSQSPEMSDGKNKKQLKKERQRQKKEHEARSRESSATRTDISMDEASYDTVPDSSNTPGEEVGESNKDWRETAPDSTNSHFEEEGESSDDLLLETLSYLLGETFRKAMCRYKYLKFENTLEHIQFPITDMLRAAIQLPPDINYRDFCFSPEVEEVCRNTLDAQTTDTVDKIIRGFDLNQRTVLRKLNDNEGIARIFDNIKTLVDTILNFEPVDMGMLLRIHADESNFDWFKNDFGDGGQWLTRSCDSIKYITLFNAGRLIAIQSLGPVAVESDNCLGAEQEKTTDQLLVRAPRWVTEKGVGGVYSKEESPTSNEKSISSPTSNEESVSSPTISSTSGPNSS